MTTPPPLPSIALNPKSGIRIGLGIASVSTVLTGQFVTKGALYGYSFMGIAFGVIATLKDIFRPTGGAGYLLIAVGAILIILLMVLLFAGLILGLGTAIYVAVRRHQTPTASRLASFLFAGVTVSTFAGLALSRSLPSRPDFHGEVHVESYFFLWPVLFAVLALLYATLFRNPRNA